MTKEKFIEEGNKRTEDLENAIQDILSNITGYDNYELDWRDDKELEIHFNEEDSEDWGFCDQEDVIIDALKARGFDIEDHDWKSQETLRINFKESFWGSFGLEEYDEDEWNEFIENYDIMINE